MFKNRRIHGKRQWLLCIICMVCLVTITACSMNFNKKNQTPIESQAPETGELLGIILMNDTEQKLLQVRDLESNMVSTLTYGAASAITDKYQEELLGENVSEGMILKAEYREGDGRLLQASVPEEVWEYQDVSSFSFNSDLNMLELAGEKYQYSDQTLFSAAGMEISPMELSNHDTLIVRGMGYQVLSVVRTTGHGYIRLKNYEDYIGGMAVVSNSIIVSISDSMLITAGTGTYRLTLTKRGLPSATKTVKVQDDKETVANFADAKKAEGHVGSVTFHIEPEGADLTINGTPVDYSEPVVLNYGRYRVVVSMTGYQTYSGFLDVGAPSAPANIDLIEKKANTKKDTSSTSKPTATPSGNSSNTVTRQIDSDHTITVSAPIGVEVYLDNVFKGVTPCSFTKIIGTQTITLSDSGYVTKSYTVDILDDGKDTKLSFADLVEVESESTDTPEPEESEQGFG